MTRSVLQLDPNYVDAKLVVGVYEYVVGALPLPFKFIIGFAGITGSKSKGMAVLREAGERGPTTSVEARTVIALFLRREGKYKDAIQVVLKLKEQYPHDYLFALEEANLRKDDGEGMAAVGSYRDVLANAAKPGYYASARLELTYFGLGDALRGQRHFDEAADAYEKTAFSPGVVAGAEDSLAAGGRAVPRRDARARPGPARLPDGYRHRPEHLARGYGSQVFEKSLSRVIMHARRAAAQPEARGEPRRRISRI